MKKKDIVKALAVPAAASFLAGASAVVIHAEGADPVFPEPAQEAAEEPVIVLPEETEAVPEVQEADPAPVVTEEPAAPVEETAAPEEADDIPEAAARPTAVRPAGTVDTSAAAGMSGLIAMMGASLGAAGFFRRKSRRK